MTPLSAPALNRIPRGLLGFLGIKNGGRNPDQLATFVQGEIALFDWYMATNRQYDRAVVSIAAGAWTTFFTVPQGQYWYVQHASFVTNILTAGQTLETVIAIQDAPGLRQFNLSEPLGSRTVGAVYAASARNFWLNPGEALGLYTVQNAAPPFLNTAMTIAYCRLED